MVLLGPNNRHVDDLSIRNPTGIKNCLNTRTFIYFKKTASTLFKSDQICVYSNRDDLGTGTDYPYLILSNIQPSTRKRRIGRRMARHGGPGCRQAYSLRR